MIDLDFFEKNGYAVIDNALDKESVKNLFLQIDLLRERELMKKAGIGKNEGFQVDSEKRGDFIFWLNQAEPTAIEKPFLKMIEEVVTTLNRNFYLGIRDFESHYTHYPSGTRYMPHVDRHQRNSARVVSFVFYLNEEWKESDGGQLRIYNEEGSHTDVLPSAGRLAIFLSEKLHEVLITNRDRRSITGWFLNEQKMV